MDCSWRRTLASVFLLLSSHNVRVSGQNVVPIGAVPPLPLWEPLRDCPGMSPGQFAQHMNLLPCPPNGVPPEFVPIGLYSPDHQWIPDYMGPVCPPGVIGAFPQGQLLNIPSPSLQGPVVALNNNMPGVPLNIAQSSIGPIPPGQPFNIPQTPPLPIPLGPLSYIPQTPLVPTPLGPQSNIPQAPLVPTPLGPQSNIPQAPLVPTPPGPQKNAPQVPLLPTSLVPQSNIPQAPLGPIPPGPPFNFPQPSLVPIPFGLPFNIPQTPLMPIPPGPPINTPQTGPPFNMPQTPAVPFPSGPPTNVPQTPLMPIPPGPPLNIPQTPLTPMQTGPSFNSIQTPLVPYPSGPPTNTPQTPFVPISPGPLFNIPQTPLVPIPLVPPSACPQIPLVPMPYNPPITNTSPTQRSPPNILPGPLLPFPQGADCVPLTRNEYFQQNIPPYMSPLPLVQIPQGQVLLDPQIPPTQGPACVPPIPAYQNQNMQMFPLVPNLHPQQCVPPHKAPCTFTTDLTSVHFLPAPNLPLSMPIQNFAPQTQCPVQTCSAYPQSVSSTDCFSNIAALPNFQISALPPVFPATTPQQYDNPCGNCRLFAEEYNPVPINLHVNVPSPTIPEPKITIITAYPTPPEVSAPITIKDSSDIPFEVFPPYPLPPIIIDSRRSKSRSWLPLFLVALLSRDGCSNAGISGACCCCRPCNTGCADIPIPYPIPIPTNNPIILGNSCRSRKKVIKTKEATMKDN